MTNSNDTARKDVITLLAPALDAIISRDRSKTIRERLRETVLYAVLNARCSHQDAISIADAECIAEAVLLAILNEYGSA